MHKLAKVVHSLTHTIRLESDGKETYIIRCMWKHGIFPIKIGSFADCVGGVVVVDVYPVVVVGC